MEKVLSRVNHKESLLAFTQKLKVAGSPSQGKTWVNLRKSTQKTEKWKATYFSMKPIPSVL